MTAYAIVTDADELTTHPEPWALVATLLWHHLGPVAGTLTAQTPEPATITIDGEQVTLPAEPGEPDRLCRLLVEPSTAPAQ